MIADTIAASRRRSCRERSSDRFAVDRQILQMIEAREADPEVVDHDFHSELAESLQSGRDPAGVLHQRRLGDLELQQVR